MKVLFIWPSLDCPPGINHGLAALSAVLKEHGHETSLIHISDALWPVPTNSALLADIQRRAPDMLGQGGVADRRWPGQKFTLDQFGERGARIDVARHAQAADRGVDVALRSKQVEQNARWIGRIGRSGSRPGVCLFLGRSVLAQVFCQAVL